MGQISVRCIKENPFFNTGSMRNGCTFVGNSKSENESVMHVSQKQLYILILYPLV